MSARVSLAGEYRVSHPASFLSESTDAFAAFYLELRQALFTAVGELQGDSFINDQTLLTSRIKELLVPRSTQLGIEIVQLEIWEAVPLGWVCQS